MVKDNRPPPPAPGTAPQNPRQDMQGHVHTLSHLRDTLALALMTMEQNTDRITAWVKDNREKIIVTRHQLSRAIARAAVDETHMPSVLSTLSAEDKDIISFLLTDDEVLNEAESTLGADALLTRKLRSVPRGLPAHLIEPLPDMAVSDDVALHITRIDAQAAAPAPAEETQKSGGLLSGWFKNQEQRAAEEAEAAYNTLVGHWKTLHRELLGLHSDRHYYVDSFMDWVGENLSPSTPDQNFAALMTQYRHPAYVIAKAQEDYNEALHIRTRILLDDAKTYSTIARPLDKQDIPAFIEMLPRLFPRPDQPAAAEMRRLLLRDFNAHGLSDLALHVAKDPAHKIALLKAAIAFEGGLKISGHSNPETVLDVIRMQVTGRNKALPVEALGLTLQALKRQIGHKDLRDLVYASPLRQGLTERFGEDDIGFTLALTTLFESLDSPLTRENIGLFILLRRSAITRDATRLAEDLNAIPSVEAAAQIRALWDWTGTSASHKLSTVITEATAQTPAAFIPLMDKATALGLVHEATVEGIGKRSDADALHTILQTITTALGTHTAETPIPAAFIAQVLSVGRVADIPDTLQSWRTELGRAGGLLQSIAARSDMDTDHKLEVLAALLLPLPTLYDRMATLENAALGSNDAAVHNLLKDAAWALNGDLYRIDDYHFLVHAPMIANIWYAGAEKNKGALLYTIGAKTHTLVDGIAPHEASNILDILHARYGFMREDMGLFNPAQADGFEFATGKNYRIIWDMHEAPINITPAQADELFKTLPMVKGNIVNGNSRVCMHPRALLALIPMDDSTWLMIDRNGNHQTVANLSLPAGKTDLIPMGKAWINPARASLMSIDTTARTLSLRVENPVFAQLLEAMTRQSQLSGYNSDGQYLTVTASTAGEWTACMAAIDSNPAQLAPAGDLSHLRFNMDTLSYLTPYQDGKSSGLSYSHKNKGGVNGRIEVDAEIVEELMQGLCAAADTRASMLALRTGYITGGMVVNTDAISNAFYQQQDAALMLLTEHTNLRVAIDPKEAMRVLRQVATQPGFVNIARDGYTPDLIRLDRATQLYWEHSGESSANALVGNRVIALGMNHADFIDFVVKKKREDWARERDGEILSPIDMRVFANACKQFVPKPAHALPPKRNSDGLRSIFMERSTAKPAQTGPAKRKSGRLIIKF